MSVLAAALQPQGHRAPDWLDAPRSVEAETGGPATLFLCDDAALASGRSASGRTFAAVVGELDAGPQGAADLADRFETDANAALEDAIGSFCALAFDREAGTLTVARSLSGQRPLYYARTDRGWAVSDSAHVLRAAPLADAALDRDALTDFLHTGVIWGGRSVHCGIRLLLPGHAASLRTDSDEATVRPFVDWPRAGETGSDAIRTITDALTHAMERALARDPGATVCLSAGLDSRTLLAIAHRAGLAPGCVTNGLEGSIELRLAARMAGELGLEHRTCLIGERLVAEIDALAEGISAATDGEADIMNMMMLHFGRRYASELGLTRVIRGHGGELMKLDDAYGFTMPEALATSRDHAAARAHVHGQLSASVSPEDAAAALAPDLARDGHVRSAASLGRSWERCAAGDDPVGQTASLLFLCEFNGRHTMNAMRCMRESVAVSLPFLDEEAALATLRAPIALRTGKQLQLALIRESCPALLRIPSSAIRVPLTAGPLRRRIAWLRFRIESRLGLHRADVPEGWLVGQLAGLFERVLLDARTLDRGLVSPDGVRDLVRRSASGDARANPLLGRLSVLELHLRRAD